MNFDKYVSKRPIETLNISIIPENSLNHLHSQSLSPEMPVILIFDTKNSEYIHE